MTDENRALQESQTRLQLAIDAFGVGVWDWHIPSGALYLSPRWKAQIGYCDDELKNEFATWLERVHPEDIGRIESDLHAYFEGRKAEYDVEFRLLAKNGEYRWIRARGQTAERDTTGKPTRMVGIHDDINDRKQAELRLRQSEEKFASIFQLSPDAIGISRMSDGILMETNRAFEEVTGYSRDELIGRSTLSLWADADARAELIGRIKQEYEVTSEVHRFIGKDGRSIHGLVSIRRIDYVGEPHLCFVVRDISARVAAEQALIESEARYREAQRIAQLGHWSLDVEAQRFLWWSEVLFDMLEIDPALENPDVGRLLERTHPEDRALIVEALNHAAATGEPFLIRHRILLKDGQDIRHLEVHGVPHKAADGRVTRMSGTAIDITERVRSQSLLADRERFFRALIEHSSDVVVLIDPQGKVSYASPSSTPVMGFAPAEYIGRNALEFILPSWHAAFLAHVAESLRAPGTGIQAEAEVLHKDGTWRHCEGVMTNLLNEPAVGAIVVNYRDVSERMRASEALQNQAREMQWLMKSMASAFIVWGVGFDAAGKCIDLRFDYFNDAFEKTSGLKLDAVRGKSIHQLWPDAEASWFEVYGRVAQSGESESFEMYFASTQGWYACTAYRPWETSERICVVFEDVTERRMAEERIRTFKALAEASSDAIVMAQMDDTLLLYANRAAHELFGFDVARKEMIGRIGLDFWHPDDHAFMHATLPEAINKGWRGNIRQKRKDGSLFDANATIFAIKDADGNPTLIVGMIRDITDELKTQQALHLTQFAMDHSADAIFIINPDSRFTYVNHAASTNLGWMRDELQCMGIVDIDPDVDDEQARVFYSELKRLGRLHIETRHRRKDGSIYPVEITANYLVYGDKEYNCCFVRDISDRKQAEAAVRLSEARFRAVVTNISDVITILDKDAIGRYQSPSLERVYGYKPEERVGKNGLELIHPDDQPRIQTAFAELQQSPGRVMNVEYRYRHSDGSWIDVESSAISLLDDPAIFGVLVTSRDITERKRMQRALAERESYLKTIVNSQPECIKLMDREGRLLDMNPAGLAMIEADSLEQVRGHHVCPLVSDTDRPLFLESLEAVFRGESRSLTFEIGTLKGHRLWMETHAVPIWDEVHPGQVRACLGLTRDVTERRRAEFALRDSERRLAELFDFLPDATFAVDTEGKVIAWNRAIEEMSGVKKHDVLGKGNHAYAEAFYGLKRPMLIDLIFEDDPETTARYDYVRREGDILLTEDANAFLYGNKHIALWGKAAPLRDIEGRITGAIEIIRDITEQKLAEIELRFSEERFRSVVMNTPVLIFEFDDTGIFKLCEGRGLRVIDLDPGVLLHTSVCDFFRAEPEICNLVQRAIQGETVRFTASVDKAVFETYFNPVNNAHNQRVSVIGVAVDITERTRREIELRQKTDEMTRFTYTVSHDLKSPLVTIRTFLGFLEQDIQKQDTERIAKDIGFIRNASDKMARLLEELLELSRIGRVVNNPVELLFGDLVKEALDLVAGRIADRGVNVQLVETPLSILGDRPRLIEVFQNLIDNAVKFMGDQAEPRIEIGARQDAENWLFYVQDNGIGVDARYRHKLFDLFEKLDQNAEGTGIGLTLVKRIIELHGGRIWLESPGLGAGTTFFFTLGECHALPEDIHHAR